MIKRQLTVDASRNLLLSDLPYRAGEKLTVIVIAENELQQRAKKWQSFFKQLQALPVAQSLTDEDIAEKIEAYRNENHH